MKFYRGYRFRIYPNAEQRMQFDKIFTAVRFTYNRLLMKWIDDPQLQLEDCLDCLIAEAPWLAFIDRSILHHAVRSLERSCGEYIKAHGTPSAEKGGHPCLRTGNDAYSSFTLVSQQTQLRYDRLMLGGQKGIRPIKMVLSRPVPRQAHICSVTISRTARGQYYASVLCGFQRDMDNRAAGRRAIGLDYSLPHFFMSTDPAIVPDDRYLHHMARSREQIAMQQKRLSEMRRGGSNYRKQKKRIAALHDRVACRRRDYLQKLSTQIADRYDIVCVETLDLKEMQQFSRAFAKAVSDNGWNEFVKMLDYKLRERGKLLVKVGKWFPSSKMCHQCGHINQSLKLSEREWTCPACGAVHNRDYNAALNIRDEGMRILRQREERRFSPVVRDPERQYAAERCPAGEVLFDNHSREDSRITGFEQYILERLYSPYPLPVSAEWDRPDHPENEYGFSRVW